MKNNLSLSMLYLLILLPIAPLAIEQAFSEPLKTNGTTSSSTNNTSENTVGIVIFGDSGNIEVPPEKSGLLPVAKAMKAFCLKHPCDFAAMTGDNIYPVGAGGLNKPSKDIRKFKLAFEEPYGEFKNISTDFRIYMALGNHDWYTSREGALAQANYAKRTPPFYMDSFFYTVKPPSGKGDIELFVIDTEMMLSEIKGHSYSIQTDGTPLGRAGTQYLGGQNARPINPHEQQQLQWLTHALHTSSARWKLIISHHPLWESKGSKHGQALALRKMLRPIICQYADAYFAGHQHTLEIHRDKCSKTKRPTQMKPLLHVISGAAGKARTLNKAYMTWQADTFSDLTTEYALGNSWGFIYATISNNKELELNVYAAPQYQREIQAYRKKISLKLTQ